MSFIYQERTLIGYVCLDRINIANANAVSSALTYGFPALTGFTGATHHLSRTLAQRPEFAQLRLDGTLVACLECHVQTYQEGYKDKTFAQTRNPILKSGKTAPIIEEGRCHLTVSLIIGVYQDSLQELGDIDALTKTVRELVFTQRIAGGSVTCIESVRFIKKDELNKQQARLCPAFVLTSAHHTLSDITQELQQSNPNATALDALIETAVLHHNPPANAQQKWTTSTIKRDYGWLVPMPVGFMGISPVYEQGQMQHARSDDYPTQFVEAVYTLGKWQLANRLERLQDAFWYMDYDKDNALYLVKHRS